MNTHVHFVVPDLFLPAEIAAQVSSGLRLPALEKFLSRADVEALPQASLEDWLCAEFGLAGQAVAPVTLQADSLQPGSYFWLRADPVHLRIAHDQLVLQPAMPVTAEEAGQMCAALNRHFADDGLHFVAPDPLRWYLRLERDPHIATTSVAQVAGKNIHPFLPQGQDGLRWHAILNEIQMLLFAHPLNEVRTQRGEWEINGLWLWGGGYAAASLHCPAGRVCTDSALAAAFAAAAGVVAEALPDDAKACVAGGEGETLVVWDGLRFALQCGDLGAWRESLQRLELGFIQPLLQAVRSGQVEKVTLDVPCGNSSRRFVLRRRDTWKFWRRLRPLHGHSLM